MRRAVRGFTLMETLVALTIFALIGVASYRVLSGVMQADERVAARSEELRRINRAFWLLQQDIEQIAQRPIRGPEGGEQPWLQVTPGQTPLQFTRGGRSNPLGLPRSALQRVEYRVDHHPDYDLEGSEHYHEDRMYLLRYTWPMLDGAGDRSKALVQVLLPDVEQLAVTVVTKNGEQTQWPPDQQQNEQPIALRLQFTYKDGGVMQRSYKVL
jgi:general secretion pathway protein J